MSDAYEPKERIGFFEMIRDAASMRGSEKLTWEEKLDAESKLRNRSDYDNDDDDPGFAWS